MIIVVTTVEYGNIYARRDEVFISCSRADGYYRSEVLIF